MLSLPYELLPRIIPDPNAAVELLATCRWLRAAVPRDLFVMGQIDFSFKLYSEFYTVSAYNYTCSVCHHPHNVVLAGRSPDPYYPMSLKRLSYLRVIKLTTNTTVFKCSGVFPGISGGIVTKEVQLGDDFKALLACEAIGEHSSRMLAGAEHVLRTLTSISLQRSWLYTRTTVAEIIV